MKTLVAGIAVATFATLGSATAADLAAYKAAPIYPWSWNGFYAGIHSGYAWEVGTTDTGDTRSPYGLFAGGQFGFNHLISPQWFVGVEIDSAYSAIKTATILVDSGFPHSTASDFVQDKYLGSARLRTGMALDRYLIYATAGSAWMLNSMQIGHNGPTPAAGAVILSDEQWHTGWAAGGGVETVLAGNWTVKVEYQFARFGRETYALDQPLGIRIDAQSIRLGLNYFFRDGSAHIKN